MYLISAIEFSSIASLIMIVFLTTNITEHKNIFQLYRTSVFSYSEDIYYRQLSNFIDFNAWLDAQIRKQPYVLILKEKGSYANK